MSKSKRRGWRNAGPISRFETKINKWRHAPLPPGFEPVRLGQRLYFVGEPGRVTVQEFPRVSVSGRLYSCQVRRMTLTLARFWPRTRGSQQ
jgi:hypothetical protein